MTPPNTAPVDEHLPPAKVVRWLLLAAVILFSAGLYFRFGLNVQPLGTAAPPATTTAP